MIYGEEKCAFRSGMMRRAVRLGAPAAPTLSFASVRPVVADAAILVAEAA
jgi:hypothetical protein